MTDNLGDLRSIEGFPNGKDEDLHALSNPPYYTAYPNPHVEDFIQQYGTPYNEATDDYRREPFVSDVSEGKGDPIYMAHTYHTKVPYKAIIPFISHYTKPGDVVFDGFCGTGATGIAAQFAGRQAILCDISSAATFIASNYTSNLNLESIKKNSLQIKDEVSKECSWLYQTNHVDGRKGLISYVIWSDVFICPYCNNEIIYWDFAMDEDTLEMKTDLACPKCKASISKRNLSRAQMSMKNETTSNISTMAKQVPVLIVYSLGNKKYQKKPDIQDIELINRIEKTSIPYWYPTNPIPEGDKTGEPLRIGIESVHQFYTKRNLWVFAKIFDSIHQSKIEIKQKNFLLFTITSFLVKTGSKLHNVGFKNGKINLAGQVPNTLYIPSILAERNILELFSGKLDDIVRAFEQKKAIGKTQILVTTQSTTDLKQFPQNSIDYIFVDPPFGSNLMYSELSFIWESWLRILTNNHSEAIINNTQHKNLTDYRELMEKSFLEMYRIIKPGRWITIEFHNSKASVWNAIQEALSKSGFIVAQVTILNKQQGTFNQMTSPGAVENDLVINAYKPRENITKKLISSAGNGYETDFVREHLLNLPIAANIERSKEMLFSKYLAYYVQHGYRVIYNGEQFYRILSEWGLEERDGYWFADEAQANEYEKRKAKTFGKGGIQPQAVLFVGDERSARQWIWNFLDQPKSYDEIYTDFLKALQTSEDEIPEVKTILEESFVRTNGQWKRPDQLTQAELEKKRHERLLRQFEEYLSTAKANQKLKEVRLEAVIAGFTECYRSGRYIDILLVGKKLDKGILENSSDLYDFIDIAEAKVEG